MKQFEPQATERYLFNEMSEDDRERFEETILADDGIFFDVAARENELVDLYCAGKLTGGELERFERTLESLPARRQKVAVAKTLLKFLDAERDSKTITIAERTRWIDYFSFRSPVIRFAAIAAILLLALASTFLLFENRRLRSLQDELAESHRRAAELSAQIEVERDTAGELTAALDRERERITSLEEQIVALQGRDRDVLPPKAPSPSIATLVLSYSGIKGGPATAVKRLELPADATRLSIVINLPPETGEQVTVRLNGETVAQNVRVRTRNAEKTISVVVPTTRIKDQRNNIEIIDPAGNTVVEYPFNMTRK
jgi:hypothetical protein